MPMACLAILLEDGRDVLAVGDLCGETGFGDMDRAIRTLASLAQG